MLPLDERPTIDGYGQAFVEAKWSKKKGATPCFELSREAASDTGFSSCRKTCAIYCLRFGRAIIMFRHHICIPLLDAELQ